MSDNLGITISGTDEASQVLKGIGSQVDVLGMGLAKLATSWVGLGAAIVGAATALAANTINVANAGVAMNNLSIQTGLSVDTLSQLRYVADISGVSLGSVEYAMRGVSMAMEQAKTPSSDAAKALKDLGLSLQELQGMSPEQRLFAIASALSKVSDTQVRTYEGIKLLGRGYLELAPMIDNLDRKMQDAAEHAAPPVDPAKAQEALQAVVNLQHAWKGLADAFAVTTFPALEFIVKQLGYIVDGINTVIETYQILNSWLNSQVPFSWMGGGGGGSAPAATGSGFAPGTTPPWYTPPSYNIPAYGGYAMGGTVPGPLGAAVPIIAHGGERFLGSRGAGGMTPNITIYNAGSVRSDRDLVMQIRQAILDIGRQNTTTGF